MWNKIDRVDDADDRRIDWAIFVAVCHSGRRAANDDHFLVVSRADRIYGDDVAALVGAVQIDRFHDEQLFAVEAFVLLGGNDGAEDASDDHKQWIVVGGQWKVSAELPEHWPLTNIHYFITTGRVSSTEL